LFSNIAVQEQEKYQGEDSQGAKNEVSTVQQPHSTPVLPSYSHRPFVKNYFNENIFEEYNLTFL